MFALHMSQLVDDINRLKDEAPAVLSAIESLDIEIYNGIKEHRLNSGSYIVTTALDGLSPIQRERVLSRFNGVFFERYASCSQFKLVIDDTDEGRLVLVAASLTPKAKDHECLYRSEQPLTHSKEVHLEPDSGTRK